METIRHIGRRYWRPPIDDTSPAKGYFGAVKIDSREEKLLLAARQASERGELETACQIFRQCAEEYPSSATAWAGLGQIHLDQRRWHEAEKPLERAFELRSRDGGLSLNLGKLYLGLGDLGRAEAYIVRSSELAPHSAWPHGYIGQIRGRQGRLLEAEAA